MTTLVRLRCANCGYGVSVRSAPDLCPMCRGTLWEDDRGRPLPSLTHELLRLPARRKEPTKPVA